MWLAREGIVAPLPPQWKPWWESPLRSWFTRLLVSAGLLCLCLWLSEQGISWQGEKIYTGTSGFFLGQLRKREKGFTSWMKMWPFSRRAFSPHWSLWVLGGLVLLFTECEVIVWCIFLEPLKALEWDHVCAELKLLLCSHTVFATQPGCHWWDLLFQLQQRPVHVGPPLWWLLQSAGRSGTEEAAGMWQLEKERKEEERQKR